MKDRELLELAAKAAGIKAKVWNDHDDDVSDGLWLCGERGPDNSRGWNPLNNDGDALRLAVRMGLFVDTYAPATTVGNVICKDSLRCKTRMEEHGFEPYAATRRAIVRAAAEIGKAVP